MTSAILSEGSLFIYLFIYDSMTTIGFIHHDNIFKKKKCWFFRKSSFFLTLLSVRSFAYKERAAIAGCVYACVYEGAYEWVTEFRWDNQDDSNRSMLVQLLFFVHLTFFIIHKNSIATSGLIIVWTTASIQVTKLWFLFLCYCFQI
jgi:hypothetical protein